MDFRANGFPGTNDSVCWVPLEYMMSEASPNEVIAFRLCPLATGYALRARQVLRLRSNSGHFINVQATRPRSLYTTKPFPPLLAQWHSCTRTTSF